METLTEFKAQKNANDSLNNLSAFVYQIDIFPQKPPDKFVKEKTFMLEKF